MCCALTSRSALPRGGFQGQGPEAFGSKGRVVSGPCIDSSPSAFQAWFSNCVLRGKLVSAFPYQRPCCTAYAACVCHLIWHESKQFWTLLRGRQPRRRARRPTPSTASSCWRRPASSPCPAQASSRRAWRLLVTCLPRLGFVGCRLSVAPGSTFGHCTQALIAK